MAEAITSNSSSGICPFGQDAALIDRVPHQSSVVPRVLPSVHPLEACHLRGCRSAENAGVRLAGIRERPKQLGGRSKLSPNSTAPSLKRRLTARAKSDRRFAGGPVSPPGRLPARTPASVLIPYRG